MTFNETSAQQTYDLRGDFVNGIEGLRFTGSGFLESPVTVQLGESQIGPSLIANVTFDHAGILQVDGGAVDLSAVTFAGAAVKDSITLLEGVESADVLAGGTLADTIHGGADLDVMLGNGGKDTFRYDAASEIVAGEFINGGGGGADTILLSASLAGTADFSQVVIDNVERLELDGAGQTMALTDEQVAGVTRIDGKAATQTLAVAGSSIDLNAINFKTWDATGAIILTGTSAKDTITGSSQSDTLEGGLAADTLTGGAGADTFDYSDLLDSGLGAASDTITDFTQGDDMIDLADAASLTFIGNSHFSATGSAELRYVATATQTTIQIDSDGDGAADARILVTGSINFTSGDLIL